MAITSSNMGLTIWNLPQDPYLSGQLAGNFARLDEHDHSNGKGVQIGTAGLQDGAVTADKLASDAIPPPPSLTTVGTALLEDGSVTTPKLADGAVTIAKTATRPQARVTRVTNQSIAQGATGANVTFTATTFDTDTMWTGGAPTRLTINTAGLYMIAADAVWELGAGQYRTLEIRVNGAGITRHAQDTGSANSGAAIFNHSANVTTLYRLNATDFLEVRLYNDSFSAINCTTARLAAAWISL